MASGWLQPGHRLVKKSDSYMFVFIARLMPMLLKVGFKEIQGTFLAPAFKKLMVSWGRNSSHIVPSIVK